MERLDFDSLVLGPKTSGRLREAKGKFLTFCAEPLASRIIEVYLDNKRLGTASLKIAPEKVALGAIIRQPSVNIVGGFDTQAEQAESLRMAGYKLSDTAYMVTFWAEWGTRNFLSWVRGQPSPESPPVIKTETADSPKPPEVPPIEEEITNLGQSQVVLRGEIAELEGIKSQLQETIAQLGAEKIDLGKGKEELKSEIRKQKTQLTRETNRLKKERADLESMETNLTEGQEELNKRNNELEEYQARLEKIRAQLVAEIDAADAPGVIEGLRTRIANVLVPPEPGGDVRLWQLRLAAETISLVTPYFKSPLTLVEKTWLRSPTFIQE
jgi:hypothetical protein